jgi:predicted enzyme related to lactoylglutathione lyase
MGNAVVHFEIVGGDADKLHAYYGDLFGWAVDADNPMRYGVVAREGNTNAAGAGIGGGIAGSDTCPEGYAGHVTFYVEVPDVEEALTRAELLGGTRVMGPERITPEVEMGQFLDPEGHLVGLLEATA